MNKSTYPTAVLLREDGPREGFQMLADFIPTHRKLALISALAETGISSVEVTSFVRPDLVPQHADAEEVAAGLAPRTGVRYRALYLNSKGLERACKFSNLSPEGSIMIATSGEFLRRNNNQSIDDSLNAIPEWLKKFASIGMKLERLMVSTAFGYEAEGRFTAEQTLTLVQNAIDRITAAGCSLPEITFADTTGYANPRSVEELVLGANTHWPNIAVGLHLHDTRGIGMANVFAGLATGVSRFDCSVGGLGG